MRFSSLDRALLSILLLTAVYGFLRPFGRVIAIIFRSKPDADFALRPIGPRLRRFLREVALQRLVIGQRPWPGLAHAFVFWGFCLFALVTVNHFATAFGLAFLDRGGFGRFYFGIVAMFAVLV